MTPSRSSGPTGGSAEAWEVWWRDFVMKELERLNDNDEALRKVVTDMDKTSSVDIRELQTRAAIWGAVSGGAVTLVVSIILVFIEIKYKIL